VAKIWASGLFVLVLVLNEMVLVLEGKNWNVADIRNPTPGFQLPRRMIEMDRLRLFEHEHEYEHEKSTNLCALCASVFQKTSWHLRSCEEFIEVQQGAR
jgi:hypothetical protein